MSLAFLLLYPAVSLHKSREGYLVTPQDEITLLKWTIAMESEAEPFEGKLAVAWTIMNRMRKSRKSLSDVILKDRHFSAWNQDSPTRMRLDEISSTIMDNAYIAALRAYNADSLTEDPTKGATHYLNKELTKRIRGGKLPSWVEAMEELVTIGKHTFYKERASS